MAAVRRHWRHRFADPSPRQIATDEPYVENPGGLDAGETRSEGGYPGWVRQQIRAIGLM
jgi:hypothetical protein